MDLENTKAQMRKGILEYCILSVLSRNSCYASDIIKELKEAEVIVVEGTLYPLLTRLKNEGLIIYKWEESDKGPPRKYYTISEKGRELMDELLEEWRKIDSGLRKIIGGR